MKNFKVLSLALAVASSLTTFGAVANETINMQAQIDDLQALMAKKENDVIFFGYARYGAQYQNGDTRYVNGIGSTGQTVGRLGNEANGGEFGIAKKYTAENGAVWDLAVMVEHWSNDEWGDESYGGVNLKRFYSGVTNIFESQPGLYVWAGRDFHARLQQGLNDYYVTIEDGQGGGFKNFDLGGAKLDFGFVGGVDDNEGSLGNDNGKYAATSKIKGIDAGFAKIDAYAHFGFTSEDEEIETSGLDSETAWLVGTQIKFDSSSLHVRYGDGANNSVMGLKGDFQSLFVSYEGGFSASENWDINYLAAYYNQSGDDATDQNEYSLIVRPQYRWNDIHSTWIETGYALVDEDSGNETDGWKVTLSQNMSIGGLPGSRPMLRFYATVGEKDVAPQGSANTTTDTVSFGAMFEAWW
ncbi:carbohydrate porin [Vibrio sp. VB16]|uniref:carbohydrate porin n=1 Tax=Vibrio sp. VB16 TaxID=2785746 RepID=UPI00189FB551|nr:carbohydrate porin [Vibrio sp. VB16]UGA55892.1 carbohydrate porin [Vibrio sp. VB16]